MQGLYDFYEMTGFDLDDDSEIKAHENDPNHHRAAWGNIPGITQKPRLIHEHNLCHAFHHAKNVANFSTPHVLITHLSENWGALSSEVLGRTADWGSAIKTLNDQDCDPVELKELYLDSPNTLAVFTSQHQSLFDHPKVHSMPIGVANSPDGGRKRIKLLQKQKNSLAAATSGNTTNQIDQRPRLLMINNSPTKTRLPQINAVIENFAKEGVEVVNTFNKTGSEKEAMGRYYQELSHSKFVMCPSGLGWDSYRIWEAITMGTIPVIEKYKYRYEVLTYPTSSGKRSKLIRLLEKGERGGDLEVTRKSRNGRKLFQDILSDNHMRKYNASIKIVEYSDGWRKTLDDLPVVWIDGEFGDVAPPGDNNSKNYLTPQLLEREYDAMAAKMETFRYEKITSLYWIRFIESFLLLDDPSKVFEDGIHGPRRFSSLSELETWQSAMKNLSSTYNNHTILTTRRGKGRGKGWVGWQRDDEIEMKTERDTFVDAEKSIENIVLRDYLFGEQQPRILSWILLIQLKLIGLAMVIFGWTKLTTNQAHSID